jgi:DNA-binding FadR family transcriptional regulator
MIGDLGVSRSSLREAFGVLELMGLIESIPGKGRAGAEFCRTVSEWNAQNGGKPWEYAIISDSGIQPNFSFKYLIDTSSSLDILDAPTH